MTGQTPPTWKPISSGWQELLDLSHQVERSADNDQRARAGRLAGKVERFADGGHAPDVGVAGRGETVKIVGSLAARDGKAGDDDLVDERADDVEHGAGGFVLHGREDEDLGALILIFLEIGCESGAAR